jgi:3-oxoacyl-(acyl-carrier-protein) synthase
MTRMSNDIVISGYAAVTAAGIGVQPLLDVLHNGGDALSAVPADIPGGAGQRWGRALTFRIADYMPPLKARKLDRCSQFAVAVSALALQDAGVVVADMPPERIGIILGCGFGGIANSIDFLSGYFRDGVNGLNPMLFPNVVSNAPASNASIEHGLKGPNVTLIQRFCSAEAAFMMACRCIQEGRADIMLTGGADDLTPQMITGFAATGQLRRYASSFGEGSGMLVLESAAHAARRGVVPRATLEHISTVGLLLKGSETEGFRRLLEGSEGSDLLSLSGTTALDPQLMQQLPDVPTLDIAPLIGRSLAMGGAAMAFLLASLPAGQQGLHLATSPEGPYYAIRFRGGLSVQP